MHHYSLLLNDQPCFPGLLGMHVFVFPLDSLQRKVAVKMAHYGVAIWGKSNLWHKNIIQMSFPGKSMSLEGPQCQTNYATLYKQAQSNRRVLLVPQVLPSQRHIYGVECVLIEFLKCFVIIRSVLFAPLRHGGQWEGGTLEAAAGSGKQRSPGVSVATYVTRATHMHTRTEACALSQPCREISCISVCIHTPTPSAPNWCLPAATSNAPCPQKRHFSGRVT